MERTRDKAKGSSWLEIKQRRCSSCCGLQAALEKMATQMESKTYSEGRVADPNLDVEVTIEDAFSVP